MPHRTFIVYLYTAFFKIQLVYKQGQIFKPCIVAYQLTSQSFKCCMGIQMKLGQYHLCCTIFNRLNELQIF